MMRNAVKQPRKYDYATLSNSVVESLVLSLLIGRDVVEGLGLASRVAAKPWSTMVDHNCWKTRWVDIVV